MILTPRGNLTSVVLGLTILCGLSVWAGILWHNDTMGLVIRFLQPIVALGVVMWLHLGNPLNWWSPFLGTVMRVDVDKIAHRERSGEDSDAIQAEILQWVTNSARGRWRRINGFTYKFLRRGDAVFFKLAWG